MPGDITLPGILFHTESGLSTAKDRPSAIKTQDLTQKVTFYVMKRCLLRCKRLPIKRQSITFYNAP